MEALQPTSVFLQIGSFTLKRYIDELHLGFKKLEGVSSPSSLALPPLIPSSNTVPDEEFVSRVLSGYSDALSSLPTPTSNLTVLWQWHGAGHEIPVIQLQSHLPFSAQVKHIALLHRPEELILRVTPSAIRTTLAPFSQVVVMGPSCVPLYSSLLSAPTVRSIPHGFFSPGVDAAAHSYDSSTPLVIGSRTTWGELRNLADLLSLSSALIDAATPMSPPFVVYASGVFQDFPEHSLLSYPSSAFWLLDDEELGTASEAKEFTDQKSYRVWLHGKADGRVVIRSRKDGEMLQEEKASPEFEVNLFDFNVQLYREALAHLRTPETSDQPRFAAKVEYSGTLHLAGGPWIGVVFESIAMDDVGGDDEGLSMVSVPVDGANDTVNWEAGARRVLACAEDVASRRSLVSKNLATARRLDMAEVASRYLR